MKARSLAAILVGASVLSGCGASGSPLSARDTLARPTCQAIATYLRAEAGFVNPISGNGAARIEHLSRASEDTRLELDASKLTLVVKQSRWPDELPTLSRFARDCGSDGYQLRITHTLLAG